MNHSKIQYISSMLIFGSVGLFVRLLPFTSAQIAAVRGAVGGIFLLLLSLICKKHLSWKRIRSDLPLLFFSGTAIGINWILLFQSYRYTTISNATICYYFAPVIVVLLSPVILKEKLSPGKICLIAVALAGIILIAGSGGKGSNDLVGIFYGCGAAAFYAAVVLINKFFRQVTNLERTIMQLGFATLSVLPYTLLTAPLDVAVISINSIALMMLVGIVHTGFSYLLYFSGLNSLKAQTAALFSYIDPLTAILLSALLLKEPVGLPQLAGGMMILGSTLVNDCCYSESVLNKFNKSFK